jgi:phosphoribosylamine--glycine ligase
MAQCCTGVDIAPTDTNAIVDFARTHDIGLVVVGPEAPLVTGLCDELREQNIPVFGPNKRAAQLEGSKAFAKEIMAAAGVPTAEYGSFTDARAAIEFVERHGQPMVVKADGLAAGKGVVVADTVAESITAIHDMFAGSFGRAGQRIVVEEKLIGPEVSVIAMVDGTTVRAFPTARDHKRVGDGDTGPNTGGMGAFTPVPDISPDLEASIVETVLVPTARELKARGTPFTGFLYAGLMMTPNGPRVLEFNARMGDPECQPILARFRGDLAAVLHAGATGCLAEAQFTFDPRPAVCVVLTSGGYPGSYSKGLPISGIEEASALKDVTIYHAGTGIVDDQFVTSGGRVLGVTALGDNYSESISLAYKAASLIHFEGIQKRTDIAATALTSHTARS